MSIESFNNMERIVVLQPVFKELSKLITGIFLLVTAISCYLLQRSFVTLFLAQFIDTEFSTKPIEDRNVSSQAELGGLKFSYGSMNFFWPLVVLVLFLILKLLVKKQSSIWNVLKNDDSTSTLQFDSFNLYKEILADSNGNWLLKAAIYLPLAAIAAHSIAGSWIFYILTFQKNQNNHALHILLPETVLHISISLVVLFLIVRIPSFIIKEVNRYHY